ncbi:hypothetical protein A2783_05600 [Microgenomates group bacterium RIFCSPHIGHO2_01_FULL_45_11]|nr:MAG: hypothetical protein A2783_05600 [Microgenomates group bacterium RIFCSPHIGHO2_01_FULL_45_11]
MEFDTAGCFGINELIVAMIGKNYLRGEPDVDWPPKSQALGERVERGVTTQDLAAALAEVASGQQCCPAVQALIEHLAEGGEINSHLFEQWLGQQAGEIAVIDYLSTTWG